MTEKTYKVMGLAGGANIAIGIISIVVGVTTGIILLVSGGKLLFLFLLLFWHLHLPLYIILSLYHHLHVPVS